MNSTKLLTCARVLALAAVFNCAAQAKPVTPTACAPLATECAGSINGNDNAAALATLVGSTWHGMTIAGLTQYNNGTGATTALFDVQRSGTDSSKGSLTFLQSIGGPAVLTLKGGNNWIAYYLPNGSGPNPTPFEFTIPGVQGNGQLHASIYTAASLTTQPLVLPPATNQVPEPAGIALVGLALAGVAASTRRRRS